MEKNILPLPGIEPQFTDRYFRGSALTLTEISVPPIFMKSRRQVTDLNGSLQEDTDSTCRHRCIQRRCQQLSLYRTKRISRNFPQCDFLLKKQDESIIQHMSWDAYLSRYMSTSNKVTFFSAVFLRLLKSQSAQQEPVAIE
jgi:hypothetical protein